MAARRVVRFNNTGGGFSTEIWPRADRPIEPLPEDIRALGPGKQAVGCTVGVDDGVVRLTYPSDSFRWTRNRGFTEHTQRLASLLGLREMRLGFNDYALLMAFRPALPINQFLHVLRVELDPSPFDVHENDTGIMGSLTYAFDPREFPTDPSDGSFLRGQEEFVGFSRRVAPQLGGVVMPHLITRLDEFNHALF